MILLIARSASCLSLMPLNSAGYSIAPTPTIVPWPCHQPRHRVVGADRARVGEADRGAGEVVGGELAAPGPPDDVLVGAPEFGEVDMVSARLIVATTSDAGIVLADQVDGDAEVDVLGRHQRRLAVDLGEVVVHLGVVGQRLDDRVADEVGEADLAAARPAQMVVDHDAVVGDQLGRHGADARRGRHGERRVMLATTRAAAPRSGLAVASPTTAGAALGRDRGWLGARRDSEAGAARPVGLPSRRSRPVHLDPIRPAPRERLPARAPWVPHRICVSVGGRPDGAGRRGSGPRRRADSRRRSRARPHRRSRDRAGTARTSLRRAIHWRRSCRPRPGSMGWLRTAPCSPRWPRRCRLLSRRVDYLLGRSASQITPASIAGPGLVPSLPRRRWDGRREQRGALVEPLRGQVAGIDADRAGDDSRSKSAGRCIAVGASHGLAQAFQLDGRGPE